MGCPMTKVVRQGSGSMLMQHPELAADIVRAVKDHTNLPVTVKIRAGWDKQSINAPEMAVMLENAGADAIAVHGRTRSQIYEGFSDWGVIKAVRDQVKVPVIGKPGKATPSCTPTAPSSGPRSPSPTVPSPPSSNSSSRTSRSSAR